MQNYTNTTQYKSMIDAIKNGNTKYISNLDEHTLSSYLINFITNEDNTESNDHILMSIMTYAGKLNKYSINKIYQQAVCQNKITFTNPLFFIHAHHSQEYDPHTYDHFLNRYSREIHNLAENRKDKLQDQIIQDTTTVLGGMLGIFISRLLIRTFTNKYITTYKDHTELSINEKIITCIPAAIGIPMSIYGTVHAMFADYPNTPGLNAMCNLIGENTYNFDDVIE